MIGSWSWKRRATSKRSVHWVGVDVCLFSLWFRLSYGCVYLCCTGHHAAPNPLKEGFYGVDSGHLILMNPPPPLYIVSLCLILVFQCSSQCFSSEAELSICSMRMKSCNTLQQFASSVAVSSLENLPVYVFRNGLWAMALFWLPWNTLACLFHPSFVEIPWAVPRTDSLFRYDWRFYLPWTTFHVTFWQSFQKDFLSICA